MESKDLQEKSSLSVHAAEKCTDNSQTQIHVNQSTAAKHISHKDTDDQRNDDYW